MLDKAHVLSNMQSTDQWSISTGVPKGVGENSPPPQGGTREKPRQKGEN